MGDGSGRNTEVVGDLAQLPPVPDVDTLILMAQDGPAIERWELELARSEAALRLAKAGRIPELRKETPLGLPK